MKCCCTYTCILTDTDSDADPAPPNKLPTLKPEPARVASVDHEYDNKDDLCELVSDGENTSNGSMKEGDADLEDDREVEE